MPQQPTITEGPSHPDHVNTYRDGLHCETCQQQHESFEEATKHTTTFECRPNAARLMAALRIGA